METGIVVQRCAVGVDQWEHRIVVAVGEGEEPDKVLKVDDLCELLQFEEGVVVGHSIDPKGRINPA